MNIEENAPIRKIRGRVVTPDAVLEGAIVSIEGDRITAIETPRAPVGHAHGMLELPEHFIYPGWYNLHVHGAGGLDFSDDTAHACGAIARYLASQGWAGYLATYLARPRERLMAALAHLDRTVQKDVPGCSTALGVHFEGPFLNPEKKGSHRRQDLVEPSVEVLDGMLDAVPRGLKALVTFAPELPGADRMLEALIARGGIGSLGHSAATYAQARGAIDRGMRHAVHLFNASSPLNHREPGVPGAFLTARDTTCEVIPDLVHLHPAVLKLIIEQRGGDGAILVTDSIAPTGLGEGSFDWAGRTVHVSGGKATLDDGTVAGSVLETQRMVSILSDLGVPAPTIARMASRHPARALGLADRGAIEPGFVADLTVLGPDYRPALTVVSGRAAFANPEVAKGSPCC